MKEIAFVTCPCCTDITLEDNMRVVPGGIICVKCANQLTILNEKKRAELKAKVAQLKPKLREIHQPPNIKAMLSVRKDCYRDFDIVTEYVKTHNLAKLFALPFPLVRELHVKFIRVIDPYEWLLNPTELPPLTGHLLEQLSPYAPLEKLQLIYEAFDEYTNAIEFNPTTVLKYAGLDNEFFKYIASHGTAPAVHWTETINCAIYELELLNRQVALALLSLHIQPEFESSLNIRKTEHYLNVRAGTLSRCLCQTRNPEKLETLSPASIEKLLNYYEVDSEAIQRAKLRLTDCALLNCS